MKTILLASFFIATSALATVTSGEVKISYPCEALDQIPRQKEEKEKISFFDMNGNVIYRAGYILRKRVSGNSSDFTIKHRMDKAIDLDQELFAKLSSSPDGELKCEYDMTYAPAGFKSSQSCSFKSETAAPLPEHFEFIKMVKKPITGWNQTMRGLKEITVESTSWKLSMTPAEAKLNPFTKKPSVEMWVARGECKLEVSGKFQAESSDARTITRVTENGLKFLKSVVKVAPSPEQGNKTAWALGIKPIR